MAEATLDEAHRSSDPEALADAAIEVSQGRLIALRRAILFSLEPRWRGIIGAYISELDRPVLALLLALIQDQRARGYEIGVSDALRNRIRRPR